MNSATEALAQSLGGILFNSTAAALKHALPQKSLYLSLDLPEVGCCPFGIPSPLYIEEGHSDTQGPDCLGPFMSEAGLYTQYADNIYDPSDSYQPHLTPAMSQWTTAIPHCTLAIPYQTHAMPIDLLPCPIRLLPCPSHCYRAHLTPVMPNLTPTMPNLTPVMPYLTPIMPIWLLSYPSDSCHAPFDSLNWNFLY